MGEEVAAAVGLTKESMMELTQEQVDEVMEAVRASDEMPQIAVREWISSNIPEGRGAVPMVMRRLREDHLGEIMAKTSPIFLGRFATAVEGSDIGAEQCDAVVAALQDALARVQAKKASL